MSRCLHFTLGPVQAFVAQARRSRDFWAGSFLLSWLSAVAMRKTLQLGGKVVFPKPNARFMQALNGKLDPRETPPRQGGVPNRFLAKFDDGVSAQQADEVVQAVWSAWRQIADTVWERDIAKAKTDLSRSKAIWDRQVNAFWEINWVITERQEEVDVLDRRKNWRSQSLPEEGGVQCGMMEGWQELSGADFPSRKHQDGFWKAVLAQADNRGEDKVSGIASDLRDGEHLCAIAFIKRRFSRHFADIKVPLGDQLFAHGWELPAAYPSNLYLAAAHWLAGVLRQANVDDIKDFYQAVQKLDPERGEWDNEVLCVEQAREANPDLLWKEGKIFAALNAAVFFETHLRNDNALQRITGKAEGSLTQQDCDAAATASRLLSKLHGNADLPPPSPFYAVLLMDGDQLGKHMSDPEAWEVISSALERFTNGVDGIVREHNGFLIYAGGDDVLAMLPLEDALPCAQALRCCYREAFAATPAGQSRIDSTLSGAIEYAHIKMPLGKVLQDAHSLLDDVAKDACGRDSIACRVWRPGGNTLEWAMPWEQALDGDELVLVRLARQLRTREGDEFAGKFFYKIRELFAHLNPKEGDALLNAEQRSRLLAVEYVASGDNVERLGREAPQDGDDSGKQQESHLKKALKIIRPLLVQCTQTRRTADFQIEQGQALNADAALLARFLAQEGHDTEVAQ